MMKVGIITQPLMHNIGGILQNMALQTIITQFGYIPITIDYDTHITKFRWMLSCIKQIVTLKQITPYPKYGRLGSEILNNFIENYINTLSIRDFKPISSINWSEFDAIVVGSDQVWKPAYSSESILLNKYLDFIPPNRLKKIAYAVSFGTDKWEYSDRLTKECKKCLLDFKAVSFREQSGVKLCRKYFGLDSECVLDPTLLLDKAQWSELSTKPQNIEDRFVFSYILDNNPTLRDKTKKFADSHNLKLINLSAYGNQTQFYTPAEWIWLIENADFIITDSFHCTVFSCLMQKHFITIVNQSRGIARYELFKKLGVEERICSSFDEAVLLRDIHYKLFPILNSARKRSISFLHDALS